MIIPLLLLWALSAVSIIVVYLRYAYQNYPKSWGWEILLIGSGFACGCGFGRSYPNKRLQRRNFSFRGYIVGLRLCNSLQVLFPA